MKNDKVIIVSKKSEYEVENAINDVLAHEKDNTSISTYLPDYVNSLYQLYLDKASSIAIGASSAIRSNKLNDKDSFDLYNKFLSDYKSNSQKFGSDLDRLLQLVAIFSKTMVINQDDEELYLYQVLTKRLEYIFKLNSELKMHQDNVKIKKKKKKH